MFYGRARGVSKFPSLPEAEWGTWDRLTTRVYPPSTGERNGSNLGSRF